MSDYAKLKKLDEESLQKLQEGPGPADECLCPIFSTPEAKKGFAASVRKAFGFSKKDRGGGKNIEVPLKFSGGKGFGSSKEVVKRNRSCGKCGCDDENIVLKHSYANIRITTPDVASFCPCPTDCLPEKEKMKNNIQVVIERADISANISTNIINNEKAVEPARNQVISSSETNVEANSVIGEDDHMHLKEMVLEDNKEHK